MGKRYYCDYCDRSFKDDVDARKKHLSGLQHVKNRTDHYSMFKDPETILKEECGKIPCKHYMVMGNCAFGLGCRFSHYTPPMIWKLQQFVAMKNSKDLTAMPKNGWPNAGDVIKDYFEDTRDSSGVEELSYPLWNTPSEVHGYTDLPPSLWPVTPENMVDCDLNKWGLS